MLKKATKILGWIVLGLIVLSIVIYIFVSIPLWWVYTSLNDSDLQIPASEPIPTASNAATYIPIQGEITPEEKIILDTNPEYINGEFYVDNKKMSAGELSAYIQNSTPLVVKFEKAAAAPAYQCPLSFGQIDYASELCRLGILRQLGSLTVFHAHYYENLGQLNRAVELLTATLTLGALVVQRPAPGGPLIETLIGMALITQSLDTLEKSVSLQAKLAPVIANFKLKDDMAVLTIKYEYQSFKNTVLIMNNGQAFAGQGTYLTQPNQTVNRYAELMRQNVKASLTPCNQVLDSAVRDQQLITMRKEASSFPGILKPNLIGRILISTVASSVTLHKPRCEVNERIDALSS